jgi:hypothetical protein
MKFIARHLNLIGLLLFAAFGAAAAGLYFQTPNYTPTAKAKEVASAARYACPMHPKVTSATPTDCSECGMKLVALGSNKPAATVPHGGGCCAEKPLAVEPPPAASCPHLAAQAAQPAPQTHADSCCPKPANP